MKAIRTEHELEIFRRRAEAASKQPELVRSQQSYTEVVLCRLGDENYCVDLAQVREIQFFAKSEICMIPNAPSFIVGMANFRGQALPILDIRSYLSVKGEHVGDHIPLLVVQRDTGDLGIVFDEIAGVQKVSLTDVDDQHTGNNLTWITKDRLGLLDLDYLLSEGNLV